MENKKTESHLVMEFGTKEDIERLDILEKRINKNPNDIEALIEKGFLCVMIFESPSDAQPYLERAVKLEPKNTEALFWLSKVFYHRGDNETAKKWLEHTLEIDPNRADCHSLLASVLGELGEDPEKIEIQWEKTIELEPTWTYPRIRLIDQHIREGYLDHAAQIALDGIKILDKHLQPVSVTRMEDYYEYYVTGRTCHTRKFFDDLLEGIKNRRMVMEFGTKEDIERLDILEKRINKNPNDIEALIEKGFLCVMIFESPTDAQPYLERAVKLEPKNTEAFFWLSKVFYHRGDNETAKKWLEHTLEIDPNRADCHSLLASVLGELGEDPEKIKIQLKKTVALEPTWPSPRIRLISRLIKEDNLAQAERMALEGIKMLKKIQLPKEMTCMEEYYEEYVTGRSYRTKWDFDRLLERIEKRRAELAKK